MAKITYSPLFDKITGASGDFLFQDRPSGAYIRRNFSPSNPKTKKQVLSRNSFTRLVLLWNDENFHYKDVWKTYASTFNRTGYNMFISQNKALEQDVVPITLVPYTGKKILTSLSWTPGPNDYSVYLHFSPSPVPADFFFLIQSEVIVSPYEKIVTLTQTPLVPGNTSPYLFNITSQDYFPRVYLVPFQISTGQYFESWGLKTFPFEAAMYYMTLDHRTAFNVAGGSSSATTFNQRTITNYTSNITGASVIGNVITLPAGTYRYQAQESAYRTSTTFSVLEDTVSSLPITLSESCYVDPTYLGMIPILTNTVFTLSSTTTLTPKIYTLAAQTNDGLGRPTSVSGYDSIHYQGFIQKIE